MQSTQLAATTLAESEAVCCTARICSPSNLFTAQSFVRGVIKPVARDTDGTGYLGNWSLCQLCVRLSRLSFNYWLLLVCCPSEGGEEVEHYRQAYLGWTEFLPRILPQLINLSKHETHVVNLDHDQVPEPSKVFRCRLKLLLNVLRLQRH